MYKLMKKKINKICVQLFNFTHLHNFYTIFNQY